MTTFLDKQQYTILLHLPQITFSSRLQFLSSYKGTLVNRCKIQQSDWATAGLILLFFFLSIAYFTNNTWLYLNTGLSSSVNWDRKLLTEEADIVTAHGTKCSLIQYVF